MELHNSPAKELPVMYDRFWFEGRLIRLRHEYLFFPVELPAEWKKAVEKLIELNKPREGKIKSGEVAELLPILSEIQDGKVPAGAALSEFFNTAGYYLASAWNKRDAQFFVELARVAQIRFGNRRKDEQGLIQLRVIETAIRLFSALSGNPSREQVKQHVEVPDRNDWGKLFRRCGLGFLKGKPRGKAAKRKTGHIAL